MIQIRDVSVFRPETLRTDPARSKDHDQDSKSNTFLSVVFRYLTDFHID